MPENDKYTFSVLRRIIDTPCELLLSDHEKLILCYTGKPYPVWIWTQDHSSAEEMDAKDAGYVPMLYTYADYAASNVCYEKIGYVLRGKLCSIGLQC